MDKKSPSENIHLWWNVLSFARQFEAESDSSPSVLAARLGGLVSTEYNAHHRTKRLQSVRVVPISDQIYSFDIAISRPFYGILLPNISAKGRIVYSEGYEKTIMRGSIRVSALHYLFMGLLLIYTAAAIADIATGGNASPLAVIGLMLALIVGFIWDIRQVYRDYQLLMRDLEEQVIDKSGDETEDDDNMELYEVQPQQQIKRQGG